MNNLQISSRSKDQAADRAAADLHRRGLASLSRSQQPAGGRAGDEIDLKPGSGQMAGRGRGGRSRARRRPLLRPSLSDRTRARCAGGCPGRYVVVRPACVEGGCPGARGDTPTFPRHQCAGSPAAPRWRAPAPPLPPRRRSRHRPSRRASASAWPASRDRLLAARVVAVWHGQAYKSGWPVQKLQLYLV